MSDYQRERLLTYVGGPFFILIGQIIAFFMSREVANTFASSRAPDAVPILMFITTAIVVGFYSWYGVSIIRAGRRRLASNHWRAEHFQA